MELGGLRCTGPEKSPHEGALERLLGKGVYVHLPPPRTVWGKVAKRYSSHHWFNHFTHARDLLTRGHRRPTSHDKPISWPVVGLDVGRSRLGRSVALACDGRAGRPLLAVELVVPVRALVACSRVADARSAAADLIGVRSNQGPRGRPAAAQGQQQGNRGEGAHGARANHALAPVKGANWLNQFVALGAHLTSWPNPDNTLTAMSRGARATARQT